MQSSSSPIEMEFGADDKPIAKELAAGDPAEWDPTKLLEHAEMMTRLKDKIYEKAKANPKSGAVLKTAVNQCRLKVYVEPPSRSSPTSIKKEKGLLVCNQL